MGMFENLIAYKDQHKITMVPQHYDEDPKLGKWVCTQRQYYKNDELLPKRYALLKSIGFQLDEAREAREQTIWMNMMFQKLVKYKKLHKNTNLHGRCNHYPKLGKWVSQQRYFYKRGELLPT
jgi:uncharacterized protein YbgA (DUF1722 family)